MNEQLIKDVYLRALEMNRRTFDSGEYDIAYRALLVALQCGQRLSSLDCLIEVERLAEKESRYIHDHHPEYESSNKATTAQAANGAFQMTAQQAGSIIHKMQNDR
jgi:hypothetical protein